MHFELRPVRPSDLDSLVEVADNPNIAANMTDRFPHPYTREAGEAFLQFCMKNTPANILAIDVDGKMVGAIGIHPEEDVYRKNAEMGYWLGEPYWGKGIVTRAVKQMVDYAFEHFDLVRIYARPYGYNLASKRILEKCGFQLEAKFEKTVFKNGELLDQYLFGIRRPEV
ncbi:MAG: GNAT family protein [Bacteroidota bacterium]